MKTKKTTGGSMMGLLTLLAIAGAQGCDGVEVDDGLSGAEGERLELDDELDLVLEEDELDSEGEEEDDSEAPVDSQDDLDLVADPGDDDGEAVINETTIYGVEYDTTTAQSKLFRYTVSDGDFATIATLTRGGANVRVDGLAMASNGTLHGFVIEANGTDSTLVTIDTSTGVVTNVGSTLTNRKIVGGAFAYTNATQQLWALDTTSNQILRVSGTTGQVIAGSAVGLTLGGAAYNFGDTADLSQHQDGSLWGSFGGKLFKINTTTGALTNQIDTAVSGTYGLAGALFHPYIPAEEVIGLDNSGTDEIVQIKPDGTTTVRLGGGLTTANMGTGDLAAKPYLNGSGSPNYTSAPLCVVATGTMWGCASGVHPIMERYPTSNDGTYTIMLRDGNNGDGDVNTCQPAPGGLACGMRIKRNGVVVRDSGFWYADGAGGPPQISKTWGTCGTTPPDFPYCVAGTTYVSTTGNQF